jgi:hypothetical protein
LTDGEVASGPQESLRFRLAGDAYFRSEQSWREVGAPEAEVVVAVTPRELLVEVTVIKSHPTFMPRVDWNPLDNEHPDINSDGVMLQVTPWDGATSRGTWILVPEGERPAAVRVTSRDSDAVPVTALWRLTSDGYQVLARVGIDALMSPVEGVDLGVIVNEKPPGRDRRRGQLVLGASRGGWTYLRGDRHDPAHRIPIRITRA